MSEQGDELVEQALSLQLTWADVAAVALQVEKLEQEPLALKEQIGKARHHRVNEAYRRVSLF